MPHNPANAHGISVSLSYAEAEAATEALRDRAERAADLGGYRLSQILRTIADRIESARERARSGR